MNLAQNRSFSSFITNFIPPEIQTTATMYWALYTILACFGKTKGKSRRFPPHNSLYNCFRTLPTKNRPIGRYDRFVVSIVVFHKMGIVWQFHVPLNIVLAIHLYLPIPMHLSGHKICPPDSSLLLVWFQHG